MAREHFNRKTMVPATSPALLLLCGDMRCYRLLETPLDAHLKVKLLECTTKSSPGCLAHLYKVETLGMYAFSASYSPRSCSDCSAEAARAPNRGPFCISSFTNPTVNQPQPHPRPQLARPDRKTSHLYGTYYLDSHPRRDEVCYFQLWPPLTSTSPSYFGWCG